MRASVWWWVRVVLPTLMVAMLLAGQVPGQYPSGNDDPRSRWGRERHNHGDQGPRFGPMGPGFGGMGPGPGMPGPGFMPPGPGFGPPGSGFGPPGSRFGPPGSYPRPPFQMPSPSGTSVSGASPPAAGPAPANDPSVERRREFEKHNATLAHLDSNRNGVIEPKELEGGASNSHKKMFEEAMAKAGIPATVPMPVSQVRDRLMAVLQIPSSGSPGRPGASGSTGPQVLSFGVPPGLSPVAGFGVSKSLPPVAGFGASAAAAAGSSPASGSSGSGDPAEQKAREFAQNLLRMNDKNKSGVLEKDEWGGLRGDPKEIDRNGDGVITQDELTARILSYRKEREAQRPASSAPSSPGNSSSAANSGSTVNTANSSSTAKSSGPPGNPGNPANAAASRKSWRFASPQTQLPEGLPEWFKTKDADGDGQVSMAEYASSWSNELTAQFLRYDTNNDGLITPGECLAAKGAPPPPDRAERQDRPEGDGRSRRNRSDARDRVSRSDRR